MVRVAYNHFTFLDQGITILVTYGRRYEFTIEKQQLIDIDAKVRVQTGELEFPNTSEKKVDNKLGRLLEAGLRRMKHTVNNKDVIYIDRASDIPLIGAMDFGIIDRDTNVLELKPLTGCNLNCIYCSVDEGENNKQADILVDPDYLIEEASKIAAQKHHDVEFNIGPHGEPLLYPFMEELVRGLASAPNSKVISINTNGTLLTKELIDKLQRAGLGRLNISLNTLHEKTLNELSGKAYAYKHVRNMIAHCSEVGLPVLLAPLVIPGYNDDIKRDIEPLVKLAKTIQSPYPTIGFQKYLEYKGGRNPVAQEPFEEFFAKLKPLEEQYDIVLTPKEDYNPFGIYEDKTLDKPLRKNQVIKARVASKGRTKKEMIAVVDDRVVLVKGLLAHVGSSVKIKIVRDKHNIYLGVPV